MDIEKNDGPILLRNTMAFDKDRVAAFKKAIIDAVEFAREHAPQLMVQTFIDDDQGICYSFQLFRDSDAILRHWQVSDPNIAEVMKYCEVRSMEVYGSPSNEVRDGILKSVGEANVSFIPQLTGFSRLG